MNNDHNHSNHSNHSYDSAIASGQYQAQQNQPLAPQGSNESSASHQARQVGYSSSTTKGSSSSS